MHCAYITVEYAERVLADLAKNDAKRRDYRSIEELDALALEMDNTAVTNSIDLLGLERSTTVYNAAFSMKETVHA